jgi:hypothetical protein
MARLNWTDQSIEDLINIADFIAKDSFKYSVIQLKRIRERAKLHPSRLSSPFIFLPHATLWVFDFCLYTFVFCLNILFYRPAPSFPQNLRYPEFGRAFMQLRVFEVCLKKSSKSVFGARSSQYRQVSSLKFTRPR